MRHLIVLPVLVSACFAQGLDYIKAHYTKYEYRIPMRDGAKLFTSVYVPKDASEKYPIMLDRTPYSVAPYGVDSFKASLGPSEKFAREGFIFVYQDVRGRYMSEGEFVNMTPHRDVKRGPAFRIPRVYRRLLTQQVPQALSEAEARGPVERSAAPRRCVNIGTLLHQQFDHVLVPALRGGVERRRAELVAEIRFRALLEQHLRGLQIASFGSSAQGCPSFVVSSVRVLGFRQENVYQLAIPIGYCDVQQRQELFRSVPANGSDRDLLVQECPDLLPVLLLGGVNDLRSFA